METSTVSERARRAARQIGIETFRRGDLPLEYENAELIEREFPAYEEMMELLAALRKSVVAIVWEPVGVTGDESDWFQCQLCSARTRGNGGHAANCPMEQARELLKRIEAK